VFQFAELNFGVKRREPPNYLPLVGRLAIGRVKPGQSRWGFEVCAGLAMAQLKYLQDRAECAGNHSKSTGFGRVSEPHRFCPATPASHQPPHKGEVVWGLTRRYSRTTAIHSSP